MLQPSAHQIVARQPASPANTPDKAKTVFHPGVMHNHQPSGRWADVQKDPQSPGVIGTACAHLSPESVLHAAAVRALYDKPIAHQHLNWFRRGRGAEFNENANLELMLRTDAGVQAKIRKNFEASRTSGFLYTHITVTQDDYADEDFQFAFGEIDRLDFEVDFDAGTFHAWFQDRYEWHPVYPFYQRMEGDYLRDTNCVHAAAVELKSSGAADYWMKGEATLPLKAILSSVARKDPLRDPPLPGL